MDRNKELLSTKQVAEILCVSSSTIRRWCDNGVLPCYKIGNSGYRRFDKKVIEDLKDKFFGKKEDVSENLETSSDSNEITVINKNITAEPHPSHYLMHKYWGRKAHNIVNEYISCFTSEGDLVLEPFMGSGVTVIEAIKLNRRAIGIDINPMSKFIVENTINDVDIEKFKATYVSIVEKIKEEYENLYDTECPICHEKATIETAVWENESLVRIKGICPKHGVFIKDAEQFDIQKYEDCSSLKSELLKSRSISYPTDKIMQYVKRSGRNTIDELFSDRALIILSKLRSLIFDVADLKIQKLLLFCFTSMLSNVSKMLPGDKEKSTYKSGWVISKFWTPKVHTERNIFSCLQLRYNAILKGKQELNSIKASLAELYIADSSELSFIESGTVDYIFTDPPYGESIAYLALSSFWNSWLPTEVNYSDEIIIDPYRKKDYDDYANRTRAAYKEFYRVLKDKHYMSFTFHNRDLHVWKAILDACNDAGFLLETIVMQEQAVSSGTQGINKKNTLTGDFVYNFKKDTSIKCDYHSKVPDAKQFICDCIEKFINDNNGATPSELYEYIIPIIVQNHAYTDNNGNVIDIEAILKNSYIYVEIESKEKAKIGSEFKWVKKSN